MVFSQVHRQICMPTIVDSLVFHVPRAVTVQAAAHWRTFRIPGICSEMWCNVNLEYLQKVTVYSWSSGTPLDEQIDCHPKESGGFDRSWDTGIRRWTWWIQMSQQVLSDSKVCAVMLNKLEILIFSDYGLRDPIDVFAWLFRGFGAGFAALPLPGLRLALLGGLRSVFHESNDPSSAALKKSRVKHCRAQSIPIIPIIFNPFHILSKNLSKHSNLFYRCFFFGSHIEITFSRSARWTLPWISQYLSQRLIDWISSQWIRPWWISNRIQHLRTVSSSRIEEDSWRSDPFSVHKDPKCCFMLLHSKMFKVIAKGLTLRLRDDSGARKLRCWLRRMGWCQSLCWFVFRCYQVSVLTACIIHLGSNSSKHPSVKAE